MDQPNLTFAKIPILDTGKFEQWKFRIHQYLQNEHYALWEVIEFGDSYKAPPEETCKARTTLLLAIPDEHQLRFNKYETAKELWEAILKTFGGNEAAKKTKKNQLKLQYGNFKAEGLETLEQTFNRLQAIVSHLEDDLDTMSPDDVYNHLKVYEPEVQKKSESNSQNMAFISSSNTSSRKEEIDIKWNMALLSMKADRFWKKTGKKITIQGSDVAGFDKSKVEGFNCHKMDHFAKECRAPRSQDRGKKESYKQGPKEEEPALKALMAIDDIGWDWSYMDDEEENHALVADDEVPTEFALMAKSRSSSRNEVYDDSYCSKSCRKNTKNLDTKISKLNEELSDCETDIYNYKIDFLENKLIEKGAGPNWLFEIDTLTNLMNYVPVVVTGKSSTNTLGTKDVASKDVKNDVSSLKYFALLNWFHKAHMETRNSNAPDGCNADDPESSGISNPTATSKVSSADQVEPTVSLTVESKIPTVSSPVPTICLDISPESLSVDTPVQTRHKSKEIEEQSFIATIHQNTIPELLQFCLFLCFLSQEEPKKNFDALKDPSWVEAMQEEHLQFKIQN
nr:hypothetical protein [Tanacetum cinerariifolium]